MIAQSWPPTAGANPTIDEGVYGPEHPNVATMVNNLGGVLRAQGDLARARSCFQRALAIWEKSFGSDHPHTAIARDNLAALPPDIANVLKHVKRSVQRDSSRFISSALEFIRGCPAAKRPVHGYSPAPFAPIAGRRVLHLR